MAFCETNLAVQIVFNALLLYNQRRRQREVSALDEADECLEVKTRNKDAVTRFKKGYFPAYLLVSTADWLQVDKLSLCH